MAKETNMAETVEADPFCKTDKFAAKNGMEVTEVGENYSVAQMVIDESFLNGIGIPMGGAYFTLGDLSFGAASHYIANEMVTLNSQIDFIASAKLGDTVIARCTQAPGTSKKIQRYEIKITDQDDTLLGLMHVTGYRKSRHK